MAAKKLRRTVALSVIVLLGGLFHAGLTYAQTGCPAGFAPGTDAWGVQGCINVGYRCPIHGSWSVQDNKCDCLPQWPVWDNDMRQCIVSSCPAGFQHGTDAFGIQGCINVAYQCPLHGSWSVSDNKCDCLPQWPVWDNNAKQCLASQDPNLNKKSLFATSENRNICINNPYQSQADGTQLVVNQNCSFNDPASVWSANELGSSGAYDFQVDGGGGCMDNHFGDQSNGNSIVRWGCNGSAPQMWDFDGYTFHWHPNPNKCLNIQWNPDGQAGNLVLWDCNGQANQKFNRLIYGGPVDGGAGGVDGGHCSPPWSNACPL